MSNPDYADDQGDEDGADEGAAERSPRRADVLIALAESAALFHSPAPDKEAFAEVVIDGHRETYRVRSRSFRGWLRHQYFRKTKAGCNSEALQAAIETIAAKAQYDGGEYPVHIRVAAHGDSIYIDIGDPNWRAIMVTPSGWQVVRDVPVRFLRSTSAKSLPIPERGGSIDLFKPFCNLTTKDEFVVLVGHMLAVLRSDANYPVLVTTGEQGSCKSTLSKLIARLTDPRSPEQRSLPKHEDDLITAAKGAHVLSFDNISGMPDWLSDAICRLATGGGAGKRRLYSDDDEILFEGRRATFLNGIEDVATRGDLVSRSNIFGLEAIADSKRRTEAEIDADFADKAPKILGALLDGLVAGLKNLPIVKISDMPRMADFALFAEAGTRAYWPAGTFINAYQKNMAASVEIVLEASTVGTAVRRFMQARDKWKGTAQELLGLLTQVVGEQIAKDREWPKRPNTLSGKLRRAAPALRQIGIHVTPGKPEGHDRDRIITIEKRGEPEHRPETSSAPSASSASLSEANKISDLAADAAGAIADDPSTFADDRIVCNNHLKNNGPGGADDRGRSFATIVGVCAQCRQPGGSECAYGGQEVVLHPSCRDAWIAAHEASRNRPLAFMRSSL